MERVLVREVREFIGKEILFKGWIAQIRELGGITFLRLRDRSGEIQGVVADKDLIKKMENFTKESCVEVRGVVREEEKAPEGIEILVKEIRLISKAKELPFEVGRRKELLNLKLDTILDYRPLALRNPGIGAIFRIQDEVVKGFREFLDENDFLEVHTSKIISQATEGGANLFAVQYFEKRAYLTQSPQFYKQMLVGAGYERVYEVGFVYRAEEHDTSRHLNEYVSLDLEMGFIEDENDVMDLEVELLRSVFCRLNRKKELLSLFDIEELPFPKEIPRITWAEVKEITGGEGKRSLDLSAKEEKIVCSWVKERFDSEFVFVTKFPAAVRPFYTMPDSKEGFSRGFDLLYRGVEITTGSQRIHNPETLLAQMERFGLKADDFRFYLEIFNYGMPPHGGLAIGLERFVACLLGLRNIREASLFPRDRKRLTP